MPNIRCFRQCKPRAGLIVSDRDDKSGTTIAITDVMHAMIERKQTMLPDNTPAYSHDSQTANRFQSVSSRLKIITLLLIGWFQLSATAHASFAPPHKTGIDDLRIEAMQQPVRNKTIVMADIRFEEQVAAAVQSCVDAFGGIDIVVNNASAIHLAGTIATSMKRFDLMHAVNVRGTYPVTQSTLPHLLESSNPHILVLAPPLNLDPRWLQGHLGYTLSKYGMSMCVLGMAEEFRGQGVAVNALWPRTLIATAAVQNLLGGDEAIRRSRKPEIVADAAYSILRRQGRSCTGHFFIDDEVLAEEGVDLAPYAVHPGEELQGDLFLASSLPRDEA